MRSKVPLRIIGSLFAIATIIYAIRTKQSNGAFVGVPFEFRPPTVQRIKQRWWNPEDERIFTPHIFGIGWSVNVPQVLKKIGVWKEKEGQPN